MGKLSELWGRLRPKNTVEEPIVEQEEEVKKPGIPVLTNEQLLDQLLYRLREPREVVLITLNDKPAPSGSVEDAYLRDWPFVAMSKRMLEIPLFQRIVITPYRWNTSGVSGKLKRSRWRIYNNWGAWVVAGIPEGDDLPPAEVYLRLVRSEANLVHPVYHVPTKLHAALVARTVALLGCRVMESVYFQDSWIYRLEPSIPRDFYTTLTEAVVEVY